MKKGRWDLSRRSFIKAAGLACGYAVVGAGMAKKSVAAVLDLVGLRQQSVYDADADPRKYALRKSQENPMVKTLYAKGGFLGEGPCGHRSHHLLHTQYKDKGLLIRALKKKGIELSL
ncbi:iron hydrogenase small subunit [Desulfoluna spongiiphila]|uniref:Ferredoxin hydrogenase small subunit n=1 Tax=Desulfoluna spongiiphila TaxID=419481 RepID=A0A1G5GEC1_9BACT|nr:iron hydrogenase small subunit [Desulfoluna spongiiphila]SCY49691.1 ferredoxin hydrogenase small subunit [Desulfoluna spongiiphila]VVS93619.1 iron hydrogenase small subunit hydb-type [Desulfoluna spongiiphila]